MLHVENRVLAAGGVADQDETAAAAEISLMVVSIKFEVYVEEKFTPTTASSDYAENGIRRETANG